MGDNVSVEEKHKFEEKIQFVEKIKDNIFGSIQVFRFIQPPYEYIMNYEKIFIQGDTRVDAHHAQLQEIQKKQHKNIAKIHLCLKKQENHMCIKDTKIHTYANYYNFTLQKAIEAKKMREGKFKEAQLAFVLWSLVDVANYLKKYGIIFGQFRADHIFLTPEGYIKIYLFDVEKNNRHTAYYKALIERSLIDQYNFAPEQLALLKKMDYEPKIDEFKSQVFSIGMIMMELMTLDKSRFYYNEDRSYLKIDRINFDLSSLVQEYSQGFLNILRGCLMQNPNQRLSLEEASYHIDFLRKNSPSTSYCLRFHDEESQVNKNKPPISTKGQYLLNGIEKRLTPSPITTLTSSTSSGFQSKNPIVFQYNQRNQRGFK